MTNHTVQPGESVSAISQKYFGDFSMTDAIALLNKLPNKNIIQPGQVLVIPDRKTPAIDDNGIQDAVVIEEARKKSKAGKYIGWGVVVLAATVLALEARKQYKKNKGKKATAVAGVKKTKR